MAVNLSAFFDDDEEIEDLSNKKIIVVGKIGNKVPRIFGNDLAARTTGDWELRKLLKVFSDDPNNKVFFYGRAVWDEDTSRNYFNNPVKYIDSAKVDIDSIEIKKVDEFHVVLGPHSGYNGALEVVYKDDGDTYKMLESTKRYCAPISRLMNAHYQSPKFMYLSDRRYRLKSFDILNPPKVNLGQCVVANEETIKVLTKKDATEYYFEEMKKQPITIIPFRFETLYLLDESRDQYVKNCENFRLKSRDVIIAANQVASDKFIDCSRYEQIENFRKDLAHCCIVGKWTEENVCAHWKKVLGGRAMIHGLDGEEYFGLMKASKYSLITFNVKDAPKAYIDNWITVKYFESLFCGCLTFIEIFNDYNKFVPEEFQVKNGKELQEKIDRCESDPVYVSYLYSLQDYIMKNEYFTGEYFRNTIEEIKKKYYEV